MADSYKELTNKILDLKAFHCANCHGLMVRCEIMLVEGVGSVCLGCYEDCFADRSSLHNAALQRAISVFTFPCRFREKGCGAWLSQDSLLTHEDNCKHREKICPMMRVSSCNWEGFSSDFVTHFVMHHGDHLINFDKDLFFLEIPITEAEIIKLLVMRKHVFVLRMQANLTRNRLYYLICNINDDAESFQYSVKHKGNSENYIKTKSIILNSNYIYSNFNEHEVVSVDLEALKQTVSVTDTITNIFKIKVKDDSAAIGTMEERMLQYFECPVCQFLMKPPIYQCQSGHSICNSCKPKLEKCPTCRAMFGSTRNYSLEGLTTGVQYPCTYHDLGCLDTYPSSEITEHEGNCPHKPYKCPIPGCSHSGSHDVIVNHLQEFHPEQVIISSSQGYTETFRLEQHSYHSYHQFLDRKIVVSAGHIFRLTSKRINDYCLWAAEVIGTNNSKNFTYEVSIIDMRRPEKKLIRTDYCLTEMSDDELFKKCIMFPNSILASYSNAGMVSFHFKIKPKCLT